MISRCHRCELSKEFMSSLYPICMDCLRFVARFDRAEASFLRENYPLVRLLVR